MLHRTLTCSAAAVVAVVFAAPSVVAQSTWNERTILEFSEAVMVPGTTLEPGRYVFRLADMRSNRHTVQVLSEDGTKLLATTHAVPVKRQDPKGDIVVRFKATDAGSPPAMASWFYPGSVYGHQFIYPEAQARQIAGRTRSIVLSSDATGSDLNQGTLHVFNEAGMREDWNEDAVISGEWQAWLKTRQPSAATSDDVADGDDTPDGLDAPRASAPMVNAGREAERVRVEDLENDAAKYLGKSVSVDAVVQNVMGPRLFTIDEPNWGDLEGEILVYVPNALGALVRADDRISVTGTVQSFVETDLEREWGWLGLGGDLEVQYERKPILVASKVVGGTNDDALLISRAGTADTGGATSASAGAPATEDGTTLTSTSALTDRNQASVGRRVDLTGLTVESVAEDRGFFVSVDKSRVFVLPASPDVTVGKGDSLDVEGVLLEMPRGMADRLSIARDSSDEIYVYATSVDK